MANKLSPMESVMWRVGHDPTLRMTVGALLFVDRSPAPNALAERLSAAVELAPRLAQLPGDPDAPRGRPVWIDDVHPSPDVHLRCLSVAEPGSRRQVLDLVGLLEAIPFDPEHSPWDMTLIEGLEGGRAALYVRAHHVLTDGVAALRLLGLLLDEPAWPRLEPSEPPPPAASRLTARAADDDRPLGTFTITIDVPRAVRRMIDGVNGLRREITPVETAVQGAQRALGLANSVSRQLMVTGGPLADWPDGRALLSRFELLSVPGARAAALALGGSRNDLLVAATAAGLGRYHDRLGSSTAQLRVATPMGQAHSSELGGNWFAPARLEVPTAAGRPGPQFGIVAERLAQAHSEPALRVASQLAGALARLPTKVLLPALRAQADSVDFAATALPGLRGERRICGAVIEESFPLGPRLGCPLNITAFGNDGRLDIGLALDPSAFVDPDVLVECVAEAFADYAAAAGERSS